MSTIHRRTNSTDPRPGSTNFPRMPPRPTAKTSTRDALRSTDSQKPSRPERTGFPRMTMRPAAERSHLRMGSGDAPHRRPSQSAPQSRPQAAPRDDAATKSQMNQTLAIAMMASPVNPLPFFLPIPLGVTMLLGPSKK